MLMGGGPGIRLMRFRGVDVYLDITVIIMMVLIIAPLLDTFPNRWSSLEVGITATSLAVLFVGSILVHELSHALIGMWLGARVVNIRLYIFGGATFFSSKPQSEGRNFWISAAGPLSNFALWGLFRLAYNSAEYDSIWEVITFYISTVNLYLGIFNALPGYPMDGGQAARSGLVWLTKREYLSAIIVMVLGCIVGAGIGYLAITSFLSRSTLNGFFMAYIAFWIISGSIQQYRQVEYLRKPHPEKPSPDRAPQVMGVSVGQAMSRPMQAFGLDTTVADFLQQTATLSDKVWLPVLREGYLMGIINRGLARKVNGTEQPSARLEQVMNPRRDLFAIGMDQDLSEAWKMIESSKELPVAVLDSGGQFNGFLTRDSFKQRAG